MLKSVVAIPLNYGPIELLPPRSGEGKSTGASSAQGCHGGWFKEIALQVAVWPQFIECFRHTVLKPDGNGEIAARDGSGCRGNRQNVQSNLRLRKEWPQRKSVHHVADSRIDRDGKRTIGLSVLSYLHRDGCIRWRLLNHGVDIPDRLCRVHEQGRHSADLNRQRAFNLERDLAAGQRPQAGFGIRGVSLPVNIAIAARVSHK